MTHVPVLLKEVIELLDLKSGEIAIDGTAGSGGHAKEIIKRVGKNGKLLLVDWDKNAIVNCKAQMADYQNVICIDGNYADLPKIIKENNFPKADGLILDLGFSSEQLDARLPAGRQGRGFSFQKSEPLILTYSDEAEPLHQFLRRTSIKELAEIISKFGEERYAKKISEAIMENRDRLKTAKDLGEVVRQAAPKFYERGRIHPATRTFQALRIYLNKELENLEKILRLLSEVLRPDSRVVIISFHSLEDRIVKNQFKRLNKEGRLKIITKKPIIPSTEEIQQNPRARSAKLRAAVML